MKKILVFNFRGQEYRVNEHGWLSTGSMDFNPSWLFLGSSKDHLSNKIEYSLEDAFKNPELLTGCTVWDNDKGHIRQWNCRCGRNPARIQSASICQEEL